ncbi:MAG: hypothetical protein L6R40_005655 [Gallowayella cf. fulva]|nr:MAG: hypothetical protein L6R40_005655 [Xanthomendoza cf. fulva]
MGQAKPPRDAESINTWRSDTLSALSTTGDLQQKRRETYLPVLEATIEEVAKYFPGIEKTQESAERFVDEALTPAVKLANTIQLSPTKYEFVPKMGKVPLFSRPNILKHQHLSLARLIDVEIGKTLKVDSPVQADENGEIGIQMMMLAPALYRRDPGDRMILLVKEVDLVKLHKPLGRRRAATASQRPADEGALI